MISPSMRRDQIVDLPLRSFLILAGGEEHEALALGSMRDASFDVGTISAKNAFSDVGNRDRDHVGLVAAQARRMVLRR